MKTIITDTQIDNVTHALALTLQNMGIVIGDAITCDLNDNLSSFLFERCNIKTVSDEIGHDDSKVQIFKKRNVSCNASESLTYQIDKKEWEQALIDSDDNEEEALLALQRQTKVVRIDYDSEITDINAEFNVEIEEL